jgi:hypothetical protein
MLLPVLVDTLVLLIIYHLAYTYFNDTFSILKDGNTIPIDQTGISWPGDQGGKYKRAPNSEATQWVDPES